MINFYNQNVTKPKLKLNKVKSWIKYLIESKNYSVGQISVVFCSDSFILDYNRRFLQHDYYTDIITFNYNDSNVISGDLFISLDTVKKNSIEYNTDPLNELLRVIIHGILHLLGYDDKNDNDIIEMRIQEANALSIFDKI